MSPDDPRHGTYAGYSAHRKDGTMCDPCHTVGLAQHKRYRLDRLNNGPARVVLGERAWRVIATWNVVALGQTIGMHPHRLYHIKSQGPAAIVHRDTRRKLLDVAPPTTPIGVRRRLQALARLGWSAATLEEYTGIHRTNLGKIRHGDRNHFLRANTAAAIVAAYDTLSMRVPEPSRATSWTRNFAIERGYPPPLAWDESTIDDPAARPHGAREPRRVDRSADPIVVDRILAGDFSLRATKAERFEVIRRWEGSDKELERRTGWNVARDRREMRQEDAA